MSSPFLPHGKFGPVDPLEEYGDDVEVEIGDPPETEHFTSEKHDPVTTRRGRVVYNRKKHYFTVKDLERISKSVERSPETDDNDLIDFLFEKIFDIGKRLVPPAFWEFLRICVENYRDFFKRMISGYYKNPLDYYVGFVKTVFQNWAEWWDQNTIDVLEVIGKVLLLIFPEITLPPLLGGPEEAE